MKIIHVARKPLSERTLAQNTRKHGCGVINIDASRTAHTESIEILSARSGRADGNAWADMGLNGKPHSYEANALGRWPTNLILQHLEGCQAEGCEPDCPVPDLNESSGECKMGGVSRFFREVGGKSPAGST